MTNRLLKSVKAFFRILLARDIASRSVTVFPDDVFITSYPRSGNTWMRFLVSNLIHQDDQTTFDTIDQRIPDIHSMSDTTISGFPNPRFLKSHEYFDVRYPKVIYIVRDVRSVFVSLYHYRMRNGDLEPGLPYFDFGVQFIDGIYPRYGTWEENVISWISVRGNDRERFLLLKYEDLLDNCIRELKKVVRFLELDRSQEDLKNAVRKSSLDNMKTLEKQASFQWTEMKEVERKRIPFVREGRPREWTDVLDDRTIQLLNNKYGELLVRLGYSDKKRV